MYEYFHDHNTDILKPFQNLLPFSFFFFTCKQHSTVFWHQKEQNHMDLEIMYMYIIDHCWENLVFFTYNMNIVSGNWNSNPFTIGLEIESLTILMVNLICLMIFIGGSYGAHLCCYQSYCI